MSIFILKFFFCFNSIEKSVTKHHQFYLPCLGNNQFKNDIKKLLNFLNLAKTQVFYFYKFMKIFVIYKKSNFVFTALQIVAPSFEKLNYGQKLLIISFVCSFYKNFFFKKTTKYY